MGWLPSCSFSVYFPQKDFKMFQQCSDGIGKGKGIFVGYLLGIFGGKNSVKLIY